MKILVQESYFQSLHEISYEFKRLNSIFLFKKTFKGWINQVMPHDSTKACNVPSSWQVGSREEAEQFVAEIIETPASLQL